ncbi:hypothetical protein C5S39_06115 [Candidatus Methanophagaceae archaeon]|nr:hypothetical protein C5S39_06115 [Methanophagales archaeon]
MNKKVWLIVSGLSSVLLVLATTIPAFAYDVDDLLSKCEIAPAPEPAVMVYNYELSPETLMPGDVGVLTVTVKNMQEKPIETDIDIKTSEYHGPTTDIDTETRYTMDAYIKEAYIVEKQFKIYNKYISAGVIGPDKKVDLEFKIQAPGAEGIYMLKFVADIEDMNRKRSKGIRYFIPVQVSGTVNLIPQDVSQNEVRLEVINECLSEVNSVYVTALNVTGAEVQPEKVYVGRINAGESVIVVFTVINAELNAEACSAVFKASFKHGVNKHESNQVCVAIPYSAELLEEQPETAFAPIPVSHTSTSAPSSTPKSELSGFGAVLAFGGLLIAGLVYLSRRKR